MQLYCPFDISPLVLKMAFGTVISPRIHMCKGCISVVTIYLHETHGTVFSSHMELPSFVSPDDLYA